MNLIRKPLPEDLIKENGVRVAFFDNLRVSMNDETKIDEPVFDENGRKIYDLFVMICPDNDPHTKVVKLAEDALKKAKGEKDFEGKTSIVDGYGESRLVPLTKIYKKAYESYCKKKSEPQELSAAEIELESLKEKLAMLEAKQSVAEQENEPVKVVAKKESKTKGIEIIE